MVAAQTRCRCRAVGSSPSAPASRVKSAAPAARCRPAALPPCPLPAAWRPPAGGGATPPAAHGRRAGTRLPPERAPLSGRYVQVAAAADFHSAHAPAPTRKAAKAMVELDRAARRRAQADQGKPSFPFSITRENPHSLVILQGKTLIPL